MIMLQKAIIAETRFRMDTSGVSCTVYGLAHATKILIPVELIVVKAIPTIIDDVIYQVEVKVRVGLLQ